MATLFSFFSSKSKAANPVMTELALRVYENDELDVKSKLNVLFSICCTVDIKVSLLYTVAVLTERYENALDILLNDIKTSKK